MTTYHHGDLPATILGAAAKMLEREGLAGLSLREAARRAGVSHSAPYRHFPDRDALLSALAAQGVEQLIKELEGRSGRDMAQAYVQFALAHPQLYRLMFAGRRWPELEARFVRGFAEMGSGAGLAAAAAWSLVHGLAHLILDGHFEDQEDFVKKVLSALRFAVGAQRSA
jgi:AcrR family transcriptional regulator